MKRVGTLNNSVILEDFYSYPLPHLQCSAVQCSAVMCALLKQCVLYSVLCIMHNRLSVGDFSSLHYDIRIMSGHLIIPDIAQSGH